MQHSPLLDDPGKSAPLPCPLSHSLQVSQCLHHSCKSVQGTMRTQKPCCRCQASRTALSELPAKYAHYSSIPDAWLLLLPTLDGMLRMSKIRAVQSLLPVIIRLQFTGFTCIVFTCSWSNQSTEGPCMPICVYTQISLYASCMHHTEVP